MFFSSQWFIECAIYSRRKLLNKISALEDPFQYFQFKSRCNTFGLCKSGPGHFASEQSFPSNFAQ